MAFKYSKILAATGLLGSMVALTYCSPNTASVSKDLLRERAMERTDPSTPQISDESTNAPSKESLTVAKTSWLDEADYSRQLALVSLDDGPFTLSSEDDSDKKLAAFQKTGKLDILVDSSSVQNPEILLKVNVESMDDDKSLSTLSKSNAGQIPIKITPQSEGKSLISIDLSSKLDSVEPELKNVEDVSVILN
jgi:hypothetical protein